METSKSSLSQFLLLNERNLFWLFVASCLVFIANWFLATHGFFEIENDRLRLLLTAVSMFSPVIGIIMLFSQDCRNEVPIVATLVFISLLLMWQTATITCFAIMLFCWTNKSRLVKTFCRLKDDEYDYKKELFSLSPVDDSHAGLVIQHGPRSQRVVVDLTIKNRWSDFDENVY